MAKTTSVAEGHSETRPERKPIIVIASGRGKTGKSVWLSWLAAVCKRRYRLRIIDADPKNASLSARYAGAESPPDVGDDRRVWIERQFNALMDAAGTGHQHDMLLDLGGGDLLLRRWGTEDGLAKVLAEEGVDPVLVHLLGPDDADLAHLSDVETDGVFAPARTIVVMNSGLVPATRSASDAFSRAMASVPVRSVQDRGGKIVAMPALDCMRDLEQAGLSFGDVLRDDLELRRRLGVMNARRVRRWVRDDMPAMAGDIAEWLPEMIDLSDGVR